MVVRDQGQETVFRERRKFVAVHQLSECLVLVEREAPEVLLGEEMRGVTELGTVMHAGEFGDAEAVGDVELFEEESGQWTRRKGTWCRRLGPSAVEGWTL